MPGPATWTRCPRCSWSSSSCCWCSCWRRRFLSVALSGRDQALDRLNRQMAELSDMLSLERGPLGRTCASRSPRSAATCRPRPRRATAWRSSSRHCAASQDSVAADRDALKAERDTPVGAAVGCGAAGAVGAGAHRRPLGPARRGGPQDRCAGAGLLRDIGQLADARRQLAEARRQIADTAAKGEGSTRDLAARTAELDAARRRLEEMRRQMAELDRTGKADKATHRGEALRSRPAGRADPGADRAARRPGAAGAGRRRARHHRSAARAPRWRRSSPTRRSSAIPPARRWRC